jgi:hypothetical protein
MRHGVPLISRYPYLWLDATYVKVRQAGRVISQAVILAYGVKESGEREVIGIEVGPSEDGAFWTEFLRSSRLAAAQDQACCLLLTILSRKWYHYWDRQIKWLFIVYQRISM